MNRLVIIRHGENVWNFENKFCGWTDVDMTKKGRDQTVTTARLLLKHKFTFDVCYTSMLKRAIETAWIALREMDLTWIPINKSWHLNERHYGKLQGQDKAVLAKEFGKEQIDRWRWEYNETPPPLDFDDKRHPRFDTRYKDLDVSLLPSSESIHDTHERAVPYFEKYIKPDLKEGKKILISGHKNCLRSIIKHLENIKEEDVPKIDVPLGVIIVYEFNNGDETPKKYFIEY